MLIQINLITAAAAYDLILLQNFHLQIKAWEKMSLFLKHIDNKNKDVLILGEGATEGLDDTTLKAEANYFINFTQPRKRFGLSLHYNGSCSFVFLNAT